MDELTDPDPVLVAPVGRPGEGTGRTTAAISAWNLVSRATGFARLLVTAAALGVSTLADSYQGANLISNVLFELLAGGLLFSVLVPTFVAMVDSGRHDEVRALAGVLLVRAVAALSALVVVIVLAGPFVMRLLTSRVADEAQRDQQVALSAFLLWFIMPQLLFYATGAVATALLQANRRFVAAAVAPVFNNLVVIATMGLFVAVHDSGRGIDLTTGEKVLLGTGTLAGTIAMTAVPLIASRRAGYSMKLRWSDPSVTGLGALARKGAWGAGDIGLNQVMVIATIAFAYSVNGGVAAYQMAFTFFVLPHAILAHPIFTTLFPRLSAHAVAGELREFAAAAGGGLRSMALLLLPAAGLLAVLGAPILEVGRFLEFDAEQADLVASVLAAYMVGLLGYSAFFLLTRASYALDDVRAPTMVYLWTTLAAIVGMGVSSAAVEGDDRVVVLGLVHGAAVTVGAIGLYRRVQRRTGQPMPVLATLARAGAATVVAIAAAWFVARAIGHDSRASAVVAIVAAGSVALVVYGAVLALLQTPELAPLLARFRRRSGEGTP